MIIDPSPSQHTRDSLHAIITRQMADILVGNEADLADLVVCRQMLERANFGRPAIDALIEHATLEALDQLGRAEMQYDQGRIVQR